MHNKNEIPLYIIVVVFVICVLGILMLPLLEVQINYLRYDFLQNTQAYQDGMRSEVEQMMSEFDASSDCRQRNALATLIKQKNSELKQPLDIDSYQVRRCKDAEK